MHVNLEMAVLGYGCLSSLSTFLSYVMTTGFNARTVNELVTDTPLHPGHG